LDTFCCYVVSLPCFHSSEKTRSVKQKGKAVAVVAAVVVVVVDMLTVKLQNRNSRLVSVQIILTPGLYPGPGIYAGPSFYQIISKSLIFAADALANTTTIA